MSNEDGNSGRRSMSPVCDLVIAICILSFIISCANTYNNLIDKEEAVNLAFANVQSVMQNRIEKIPDMVKVADAAAKHLETIYADIAEGRAALSASSTPEELDAANTLITEDIDQFLAVIENYPTITASEQYTSLMDSIEGAANRINVAREDYNKTVSEYNSVVKRLPDALLANILGFEVKETFKADPKANQTSIVDFGD